VNSATLKALADYQKALERFEAGQLAEATQRLDGISGAFDDLPVAFLKARIGEAMGRQRKRRSSDAGIVAERGVISLNVK
jgi:hypothetical protein